MSEASEAYAYHCPRCEVGVGGVKAGEQRPSCWECGRPMSAGAVTTILDRKVSEEPSN